MIYKCADENADFVSGFDFWTNYGITNEDGNSVIWKSRLNELTYAMSSTKIALLHFPLFVVVIFIYPLKLLKPHSRIHIYIYSCVYIATVMNSE